jgi:hypothetical protein
VSAAALLARLENGEPPPNNSEIIVVTEASQTCAQAINLLLSGQFKDQQRLKPPRQVELPLLP